MATYSDTSDFSPLRALRTTVGVALAHRAFLLALLLVAAPTAARGQFPAPTTAGIQATYASETAAPPMRMRARFPDHRIEGAVAGGALGVGWLAFWYGMSKINDGTGRITLAESPWLQAAALTLLGTFIGSVIPKQQ